MPKSDTNALSDLQIKVIHYLSTPGKTERHVFLAHLKANTLVLANRTSDTKVVDQLQRAIELNQTGACRDGIERFKKAFPEVFPSRRKVQILVELEVEGYDGGKPDGRVCSALTQALVNLPLDGGGRILGAEAGDPQGTPFFARPTRTRKSGSLA
jgi:hypothetical protein